MNPQKARAKGLGAELLYRARQTGLGPSRRKCAQALAGPTGLAEGTIMGIFNGSSGYRQPTIERVIRAVTAADESDLAELLTTYRRAIFEG